MPIELRLIQGDHDTVASWDGDVLIHDGTRYDLSAIPDGGQAEPGGDHPFVGPITRQDGEIVAAVLWFYDATTAERHQPATYPVFTGTGDIPDPVSRLPIPEEEPAP